MFTRDHDDNASLFLNLLLLDIFTFPNFSFTLFAQFFYTSVLITFCLFRLLQPLECSPVIAYELGRRDRETKLLLRGDCFGRIAIWEIPHISEKNMKLVRQESFENLPGITLTSDLILDVSVRFSLKICCTHILLP